MPYRLKSLVSGAAVAGIGLWLSVVLAPSAIRTGIAPAVVWLGVFFTPFFIGRRAAWIGGVSLAPVLAGLEKTGLIMCPELLWLWFAALFSGTGIHGWFAPSSSHPSERSPTPLTVFWLIAALVLSIIVSLVAHFTFSATGHVDSWLNSVRQVGSASYASPDYAWTTAIIWLLGLGTMIGYLAWAPASRGSLAVFTVLHSVAILIFVIIQWAFDFPQALVPWVGTRALSAPYEDIHSLGAIAASVFAGLVAILPARISRTNTILGFWLGGLVIILVATWSRSAWMASGLALALSILLRLHWRRLVVVALCSTAVLVAGHFASKTESWNNHPYLWRLGALIRLENPVKKDPSRVALWVKATDMIAERPVLGHGLGAFYSKATNYSRPGDPYATEHTFAHNMWLQFAAEAGVPSTLLLVALVALALGRGVHLARLTHHHDPIPRALTYALGTYLVTQLTANALNIYTSNQFFFWTLMAALLTWPTPRLDKDHQGLPRGNATLLTL